MQTQIFSPLNSRLSLATSLLYLTRPGWDAQLVPGVQDMVFPPASSKVGGKAEQLQA